MSDAVFREQKEAPALEVKAENKPTDPASYAVKEETPIEREYKDNLELWETEGKKKYVNEYFDTHKTSSEFMVKMPVSMIDKFVKEELTLRNYEKTTANYRKILEEVEQEIGSRPLELFERLKKITGYIKAYRRLREAKQKLGAYKPNV